MHHTFIQPPKMKLVGITARTSNQAEFNPETAKIGSTIQKYISEALYNKISSRKKPGTTYCVYTEYETDHTGSYTYFIGEEVELNAEVPEGFKAITIDTQFYSKFTTAPGTMPNVCIDMWQKIWKKTPEELGGKRTYTADFEVYDDRALDPSNTVLDIYIGVNP